MEDKNTLCEPAYYLMLNGPICLTGITIPTHFSAFLEKKHWDFQYNVFCFICLKCYGHVLRKEGNDWVKKCMEYEVEGTRPRDRPKKTWREIVEKDCRARGLNTEDAMDHSRWRKQIGMIDDHDECEWVNVSSGTGSPGLSRTNSTEPYNGCVCVCCLKFRLQDLQKRDNGKKRLTLANTFLHQDIKLKKNIEIMTCCNIKQVCCYCVVIQLNS